jgi:electron transfer flavoprotein alpha subunit
MKKNINKEIWVVGDLRNIKLFGYTHNLLAKARMLAEAVSGTAVAVLMGSSGSGSGTEDENVAFPLSMDQYAPECLNHGADKVCLLDHSALGIPRTDLFAEALTQAIHSRNPMLVLFPLTDFGRETAARCARLTGGGLMADCVDMNVNDDGIVGTCPAWGGDVMCELVFTNTTATGFATVPPHAYEPRGAQENPGIIERIDVNVEPHSNGPELISSGTEPEARRKLEEAEVVVVGGAGLESADLFGALRHLAAALGGELGTTRPPVMEHWVDEDRMVGQTGKTVRPNLLISIGTSGAVQYTAGIMESGTIVAINRDKNAPIFQIADVGIVADAKRLVPLLTARVREVVMRELAHVWSDSKNEDPHTNFGTKVRTLRESNHWTLETLAEKTGRTPEFIQQVENNEIAPSVSFLLRLSRALGVDPGTFLREEDKKIILDQRAQAFVKRTKNYYYQTLTPNAESEHLRAFLVAIEPRQTHKPVAYKHEGEEFVFVMEGALELTLGKKVHKLKNGESLHFNSETSHKLKNVGNEKTQCLVVLYTP